MSAKINLTRAQFRHTQPELVANRLQPRPIINHGLTAKPHLTTAEPWDAFFHHG